MLSKLIYASRASRPMSEHDLTTLLSTARNNNERRQLTGLLLYCNQSFLQILEGPPDELEEIYKKIEEDPRHTQLRMLSRGPIETRTFSAWSMGFEHVDEDRLAQSLPGFKAATQYPLVNADLIRNGTVAETLLNLYQRNTSDV